MSTQDPKEPQEPKQQNSAEEKSSAEAEPAPVSAKPDGQSIENNFEKILDERLSRRGSLWAIAGGTTVLAFGAGYLLGQRSGGDPVAQVTPTAPAPQPVAPIMQSVAEPESLTSLTFPEIPHTYDTNHHVAEGYNANVLLRWGDPITTSAPEFDGRNQTVAAQSNQFGYNNDFIGFMPLPYGSQNSERGLLCVNHETTHTHMMFPGYDTLWEAAENMSKEQTEVEMAAHGHAIVEVQKVDGAWQIVKDSKYNRRITAMTEMELTGPVAGHERLKTKEDPSGRKVLGTFANCAGGVTPWGTILTAEENFDYFFDGDKSQLYASAPEEIRNYSAYRSGYLGEHVDDGDHHYGWYRHHDRFNLGKEPREFNRFGWMVEIDPYDPKSKPKKRTALGRFGHEGATIVAEDGKPVIAYMGDDKKFQCVYKFISKGSYNAADRAGNMDLLDEGTLYAARFDADGTGRWIEMRYWPRLAEDGLGDLKDDSGVLIELRNVAKELGATAMDRPEDVEANPLTGRVYVMLTKNKKRELDETNPANPRANNRWGQILEILPPGADGNRDHWSKSFDWELMVLAGDPSHPKPEKRGRYHDQTSEHGWFSNPDNLAFDPQGRMWIATDGCAEYTDGEGNLLPFHDGLWACETTGEGRALTKHFFGCPMGAELCGPAFTPDGKTLFVAVQSPGREDGTSFDKPITRWPDFQEGVPAKSAVVVITKKDGGTIGS